MDRSDAATGDGFAVRPWRDGLDEEIEADQEYEAGMDGCVCPGPDTCAGPPCVSAR